jgi:hypothetical protein
LPSHHTCLVDLRAASPRAQSEHPRSHTFLTDERQLVKRRDRCPPELIRGRLAHAGQLFAQLPRLARLA